MLRSTGQDGWIVSRAHTSLLLFALRIQMWSPHSLLSILFILSYFTNAIPIPRFDFGDIGDVIGDAVGKAGDAIGDAVDGFVVKIGGIVGDFIDSDGGLYGVSLDEIKKSVGDIGDDVEGAMNDFLDGDAPASKAPTTRISPSEVTSTLLRPAQFARLAYCPGKAVSKFTCGLACNALGANVEVLLADGGKSI